MSTHTATNRLDYPAADGRTVTEGHAAICREHGHAATVRDGVDLGVCPRCGDVTRPAARPLAEVLGKHVADLKAARAEEAAGIRGRVTPPAPCPVVYPFGTLADAPCPSCGEPVHQHHGAEAEELAEATDTIEAVAAARAYDGPRTATPAEVDAYRLERARRRAAARG